MVDFPLMLLVKLPVVDGIQPPQSNEFASGVENKGTGDSKLNDSPVQVLRKHVHSQDKLRVYLYVQTVKKCVVILKSLDIACINCMVNGPLT